MTLHGLVYIVENYLGCESHILDLYYICYNEAQIKMLSIVVYDKQTNCKEISHDRSHRARHNLFRLKV